MTSRASRGGVLQTFIITLLAVSTATEVQAQQQRDESRYAVAERSAHETRWERLTWTTTRLGQAVALTNSFVEWATGLNFFDETTRQFQSSREEWVVFPEAIVAQSGQHKVLLAHNLNLAGSVDVLLPSVDGLTPVRLVSNPVGLGFYDPVDGKHALLAEIKDCAPQWGAASNEIVFRDCFTGISGSIRYLYTLAGLHQHVVIQQRLRLPAGFSDKTRLECYTEFAPDTPQPQITTRVLRQEHDPVLRAQMVEPDFTDSELDFGNMAMRGGTAFALGETSEAQSIRVGKRFDMTDGRRVLTEAVEWKQLEPLLAGLASLEPSEGQVFAVNSSRQIPRANEPARLPRERLHALGNQKEIQLASSPLSAPAVVIDYELLGSATNMVLKGDTVWFVSGLVNLSGTTRLEGCVVKFTNSASARINITGTIDCQTDSYRPAIFTSQYDSTVGENIGSGTPTNYPAALVINTSGNVLHDLRFSYATNAVTLGFSAGQISLTNVQFVNCQYPIDSSANDENTILADNCLFDLAKYGIKGGRDLIVRGQHLTAHRCEKFAHSPSGGDSYAYLTNCLLVGVTNWGSDFTFVTNSTAYFSTDTGGIFQTAGAGAHYLATTNYLNAGTTNISTALLAVLRKKTTYPPIVLSNAPTITASTNLAPQALRDSDTPDLGYHYDALDFIVHYCAVTNATVTVTGGTAVACYNDVGLWLQDGTTISSIGTPLLPNRFTRYSAVQEQPVALGTQEPSSAIAVDSAPYGTVGANAEFRFTEFSCPAGGGYHLYHSADLVYSNLLVRDCALWNGVNRLSGPSSNAIATVKNSLFHRSTIYAVAASSQCRLAFSNNLVFGAAVTITGPSSDLWQAHDNAFDGCSIVNPLPITNSHNAYINSTGRLTPTNAADVVLSSFTYASGPLGDYYQLSTNLMNAGSLTNAALAGLYHYTTGTNQVREANSVLDIGLHYVAVSNGAPVDTDGDSQADYFEDTNGNGIFETSDFGVYTNFLYISSAATNFQSITEDEADKFDRPDSMGAVGPNHFMAVLNFVVKVYDKSTGVALVTNSLDDFLRTTITNGPYQGTYPNTNHVGETRTGDPRVLYDPGSQRWFACAAYIASNHVLLAVSKTSDPVGNGGTNWISENWTHYLVPMGQFPTNSGSIDQLKLAVGSNGVYIAAFATPFYGSDPNRLRIAAMRKTPFLDFSASTVQTDFIFDGRSNQNSQIVVDFDPVSTNDSVWLIDVDQVGVVPGTNLYFNQIQWTNGSPAGFAMTNWGRLPFEQPYAYPQPAPQTNGPYPQIWLIDSRLMSATLRTLNGTQYLWTCRHIGVNQYGTNGTPAADRSAVEWFKIQTSPTVSIVDSGRIHDASASNPKFYYFPSLAINRNGDMVIGFSGSSVNDFVGAFYWGQLHNGASVSVPIRYFAGKDWLDRNGGGATTVACGDYSSTTLDPADGITFWTIQQYAETRTSGINTDTYTWGTRVTAVRPY